MLWPVRFYPDDLYASEGSSWQSLQQVFIELYRWIAEETCLIMELQSIFKKHKCCFWKVEKQFFHQLLFLWWPFSVKRIEISFVQNYYRISWETKERFQVNFLSYQVDNHDYFLSPNETFFGGCRIKKMKPIHIDIRFYWEMISVITVGGNRIE